MNKIDTNSWKEYSMKQLRFSNYHGKRIKKADRKQGNIPFVTAKKENTGIAGTIGNDIATWHNPITIDMFGNVFYHDFDCAGDDNVYAFVNDDLNKYVKLYISAVISAFIASSFSYGDQFRQDNADALKIKLPSIYNEKLEQWEPDWTYMENYMRNIIEKSKKKLETLFAITK